MKIKNLKDSILLILPLAFILLSVLPATAEVIKLRSGKTVEGVVVETTDEYIKLDEGVGVNITYYFDNIVAIDGKKFDFEKIKEEREKALQEHQEIVETAKEPFSYTSPNKSFIWEVKSNTNTVYILGSIHYADESFYPLPVAIEKPFQNADVLVVESDIYNTDTQASLEALQTTAMYTGGATLKDDISEETFNMLKDYLAQLEIDVTPFLILKPWLVSLTLEGLEMHRLGYNPDFGIDIHFLRLASGRKKIIELEGVEEQVALLSGFTNQELVLKYTLVDFEYSERTMSELVNAWKKGDVRTLEKIAFEDELEENPEFKSFYDDLLYKRNDKMVKKINEFLKDDQTYFVVVGAGHLVGQRGILIQLEQLGYQARQL